VDRVTFVPILLPRGGNGTKVKKSQKQGDFDFQEGVLFPEQNRRKALRIAVTSHNTLLSKAAAPLFMAMKTFKDRHKLLEGRSYP